MLAWQTLYKRPWNCIIIRRLSQILFSVCFRYSYDVRKFRHSESVFPS